MFSPNSDKMSPAASALFTATDSGNSFPPTAESSMAPGNSIPYFQTQPDIFDGISAITRAFLLTSINANQFAALHEVPLHVWQELQVFCGRMITHQQRSSSQRGMPQSSTLGINCVTPDTPNYPGFPFSLSPASDQHPLTNYFGQGVSIPQGVDNMGFRRDDEQLRASAVLRNITPGGSDGFPWPHQGSGTPSPMLLAIPDYASTSSSSSDYCLSPGHDDPQAFNIYLSHNSTTSTSLREQYATFQRSQASTGHGRSATTPNTPDSPIECLWSSECCEKIPSTAGPAVQKHIKMRHYAGAWPAGAGGTVRCRWDDGRCKKVLKFASLGKHIASRHLLSTRVRCDACGSYLSRSDSLQRHADKCPAAGGSPV